MCMMDIAISRKANIVGYAIDVPAGTYITLKANPRRIWLQVQDASGNIVELAFINPDTGNRTRLRNTLTTTGIIMPYTVQSHPGFIHQDLQSFATSAIGTAYVTEVILDTPTDIDVQKIMAQLSNEGKI